MAIYHFSGTVISRSQGRSSVAAAAYRSAEKLHDERQDKTADFSRKQDVIYKEILLPENAPEWMKDRNKLWNAVEAGENRKDAQLAREFNFSLPKELTHEQNVTLAREFVQKEFVDRGMVADLCIHDGKTKDGEEQPHAHVMLTMRKIEGNSFGQKERSWNAKENIMLWRENWAECANRHLALNGIDQRIDHRTLEEQGIDLEAQKKIGPDILRVHDARVEDHLRIARENGEKILDNPNIALTAITRQQSTFTHHDVARFVHRHSADSEQFQTVYDKVKAAKEIVYLGKDEQGRERFTTREMLELETKMLANAKELERLDHKTGAREPKLNLSEQQRDALKHITAAGDIKCVLGYAGTGKSYLLHEARETWEKEGYKVHGATLSGIAAENLEGASGIESRTIASRCYYWDKGEQHLTKRDVLVVDEAGMIGSRQMTRILDEAKTYGAKVVLIGDPQQLQAIDAGASFRAITEQTGFVELTEVRRQHDTWQKEATKEFANGKVSEALEHYDKHNHIHEFETRETAKKAVAEMWNDARITHPEKTQIMLAYTRKDAQELNEMARDLRKENHELGQDHVIATERGERKFAENDRLYFLQNNRDLGVKNGTLGTVEKIQGDKITVRLDQEDLQKAKEPRQVTFDIKEYKHIDHGYAATVHKAQGVTVDRSYVLASKHLDGHASYVGMSRHRESVDLFYGKDEFANKKELAETLGRDRSKDVSLDYKDVAKEFAKERGIESPEISKTDKTKSQYLETTAHKEVSHEIKTQQETRFEVSKEPNQEVGPTKLSRSAELAINAYIDKQAKLNELMQNKNENLSRNPTAARLYAQEAVALDKSINEFARQVMKDPELKKEFSQYNHNQESQGRHHGRQPSVADRGGWDALKDRQKQNQLNPQDRESVSRHLQGRVESQALERQLSRDRGLDQGRER